MATTRKRRPLLEEHTDPLVCVRRVRTKMEYFDAQARAAIERIAARRQAYLEAQTDATLRACAALGTSAAGRVLEDRADAVPMSDLDPEEES